MRVDSFNCSSTFHRSFGDYRLIAQISNRSVRHSSRTRSPNPALRPPQFFIAAQLLEPVFRDRGCGTRLFRLGCKNLQRRIRAGEFRANAFAMRDESGLDIWADAGIQLAVTTFQQIQPPVLKRYRRNIGRAVGKLCRNAFGFDRRLSTVFLHSANDTAEFGVGTPGENSGLV